MVARGAFSGETRHTGTGEEMGMNKSGTSIVVVLTLGARRVLERSAGAEGSHGADALQVTDSDGRVYEATNIEPLNALEDALYRCTIAARDPTTCQEVACAPMQ